MLDNGYEFVINGVSMLESEIQPKSLFYKSCLDIKEKLIKNPNDVDKIINSISEFLFNRDYTVIIAKCFPKILLQMLSHILPLRNFGNAKELTENIEKQRIHLESCLILGKLILFHPDVLQFSLQYFKNNPSPFEYLDDFEHVPKKRRLLYPFFDKPIGDIEIAECCLNFLTVAPNIFRPKWKWSTFIGKFIVNADPHVKWITCQCIAILSGMSEVRSHQLEENVLGSLHEVTNCMLKYATTKDCGWNTIVHNEEASKQHLEYTTKNENVVNVAGILLPVHDAQKREDGHLVLVKSTQDNLRSLALAVATGKATCLVGPVGCGKTALVEHLASITGRGKDWLRKVQLGDQTDSRTLLGTYRCTDVPGEFVWQPGVLTQAVQQGQWLLLEDVDCAAIDVASVLSSLLERNVLSVPGYRDALPVAPGFLLFLTQRANTLSGQQKQNSNAIALLQKHWAQINVEPLSRLELVKIVETLFPQLKTISSRMVDVFMLFSVGSHQSSLHNIENEENYAPLVKTLLSETSDLLSLRSGRLTSTRDLVKWCSRAVVNFDVSSHGSALKVLQDAIDIFACCVPEREARVPLAKAIGAYLGIVETKAEYYCNTHKPTISLQPTAMHIGRAIVPRKEIPISSVSLQGRKVTFSFTRPSTCLLERIACCVNSNEPVLLVGETGTGKTSSVQYLAKESGNKLIVINMNQQSDSADLLGGYKPVDLKYIMLPIRKEFEALFRSYYDVFKNAKFLEYIAVTFESSDWKTLVILMKQSQKAAMRRLCNTNVEEIIKSGKSNATDPKTEHEKTNLLNKWVNFGLKLSKLELQIKSQTSLAFSFIEGSLVRALRKGYWVLLDEINLASAETLECLSGLLEGGDSSISLLERGDDQAIERHKDFTLFACMNPATDVGKRDLPAGLRNRFTEFFVDELVDKSDLLLLVGDYLKDLSVPLAVQESIYKFYMNIRKEAKINLMDGTGQSPHFSLRTLCRALSAAPTAQCGTVTRSLYETACLSFLTQLDSSSHSKVENQIAKAVLGNKNLKSVLNQPIPEPKTNRQQKYIPFEGYWVGQGKLQPVIPNDYVLTPSVRKNLRDLVRIISLAKLPILLQGDTSVGKTSLITYIAKVSGNHCVRINNHQHTDLQEYVGSYATDSNGKLVFREGVLVEAMRKGHWIILDELNLAPSEVLEALNRVLDDNRELFIPETQQVVKADPNFMLFATQNPPGLYGGRKLLSRAFRNRFVELHFDEIPRPELETILHQRCHMPPSYCKKVILVMAELQARRRGSAAVQGKEGFITLRDLFRWGQRYKSASDSNTRSGKYYDWDQHIADEGYLVLAGRVRQLEERAIIREVLQKHIKRTVDPEHLFSLSDKTSSVTRDILQKIINTEVEEFSHVVWTFNMRRLAVLIAKSFIFKEPVLLVGETGCGKTTVCQVLAALNKCNLLSVNCHMHTEGADFLGGLRPVRHYNDDGKLFEWVDGPLIDAMKTGQMFLADEISLADDSVLERLNSLLEPERQLLLAEKGLDTADNSSCIITAHEGFHFIGTMNPGGDYGKKELSPALRNRFTEIWCDHISTRDDLLAVLEKSILPGISLGTCDDGTSGIGNNILDFVYWFKTTKVGERFPCSIRDLLSWVHFINVAVENNNLDVCEAFVHGASLVFLDCFGTGISGAESLETLNEIRIRAINFLLNQIVGHGSVKAKNLRKLLIDKNVKLLAKKGYGKFGIEPFFIPCGDSSTNGDISRPENGFKDRMSDDTGTLEMADPINFSFTAPTTGVNTMRLLRGLQLNKAILLEGSPGVGKTSLVTALAKTSGHKILRINLSDQTDISDLFGADLPTPEGTFAWQEGAFLTALQNGDWILLDELNLAPQPVLEGLNACLDHRGEIFIPELGKTFKVKRETRIFACQNPLRQGGSRRGLPKSFLNRFIQVYVDTLLAEDLLFITSSQYPLVPDQVLRKMIQMNEQILHETSDLLLWGHRGSPWELNLRDIQRWCDGIMSDVDRETRKRDSLNPGKFAQLLYINRMRTVYDKERVKSIYEDFFCPQYPLSNEHPVFYITQNSIHVGDVSIQRNQCCINKSSDQDLLILRNQLPVLKSLIQCVNMNWLSIMVGPTSSGKNSCVEVLAQLIGKELNVLPVVSSMDTSDLLGGFEQADYNRHLEDISGKIENIVIMSHQDLLLLNKFNEAVKILHQWETFKFMNFTDSNVEHTMEEETKLFGRKEQQLQEILNSLLTFNNADKQLKLTIQDMSSKLCILKEMVLKEGSINAGGKFEWVDSLLVKCLLNGNWLLVDNVNLCSSAVLDRLNGLLEPNGVLSIPERGGSMNVIKPHPDFRMFFTMDPKNGEISRAMRNRGVEIYIIGPEETIDTILTETVPALDMSAMLLSTGLAARYHKLFVMAHDKMCSFIQSFEKPSQCHLLQTAFLTNQQILRGEHVMNAIIKSFSDVYIKSRTSSDFLGSHQAVAEFKNEMLNVLDKLIKSMISNYSSHEYCDLLASHTFFSAKLQRNSSFEIVKKQALFLNIAVKACSKGQSNPLKLSLLLYYIYHLSSKKDFRLRNEYIIHLLSSQYCSLPENEIAWLLALNKNMFITLSDSQKHIANENYPWDVRFLPEIKNIDGSWEVSASNKLSICLYYLAIKSTQELSIKSSNGSMTALDYSVKVLSGNLSDFSDMPVLKHCSAFINLLDNAVIEVLRKESVNLTNEDWCDLIVLFNWRTRFYRICNEPLLTTTMKNSKKSMSLREDVILNMNIHYKWLSKILIDRLSIIGGNDDSFLELYKLMTKIDKGIMTHHSPLRPLSKHIKKYLGQPTPFPNEDVYFTCLKRDGLVENINILTNENQKLTQKVVQNVISGKHKATKGIFKNIEDSFNFPNEDLLARMKAISCREISDNNLSEIKNLDDDECEDESRLSRSNIDRFGYEVQLWPIKEYLVIKVANIYKVQLFKQLLNHLKKTSFGLEDDEANSISALSINLIKRLSEVVGSIPLLPVKLHTLLSDLTILQDKPNNLETFSSLLEHSAELWDLMTSYLDTSPATNPSRWLKWSSCDLVSTDSSIFEEQAERFETFPIDFPHVTYSTVKLILEVELDQKKKQDVFEESSLAPSTLTGWQGRSKQLEDLHSLLWRNMALINTANLENHLSDAQTIITNFERMVLCLECALSRKDNTPRTLQNCLKDSVQICVAKINEAYERKSKYCTREMTKVKKHVTQSLMECSDMVHQLVELLSKKNAKIVDGSKTFEEKMKLILLTARAWTLFASCNVMLLSEIGTMDPVKKNSLKLGYIRDDVSTIEHLLDLNLLHAIVQGSVLVSKDESEVVMSWKNSEEFISRSCILNDSAEMILDKESLYRKLSNSHPHCTNLIDTEQLTKEKIHTLSKGFTYRPAEPTFNNLSKEYVHFVNSLASPDVVMKHYNHLSHLSEQLLQIITSERFNSEVTPVINKANDAVRECATWQYSVKSFYVKILKQYSSTFPDLTKPFLNVITQLFYGLGLLKNSIVKMITMIKHGKSNSQCVSLWTEDIVRFPVINTRTDSLMHTIDFFTSKCLADFLKTFNSEDNHFDKLECFRFLKVSLQEIYSGCVTRGSLEKELWNTFCLILNEVVVTWQKQQREIDKKKQEEDLLYVNKVKCDDKTEEEQIEDELVEMFPSYSDLDFGDFKAALLEQKKMKPVKASNPSSRDNEAFVTFKDIVQIATLHSDLVTSYTISEWLSVPASYNLNCDYLSPLMERFTTFAGILDHVSKGLDEDIDGKLIPSLLVLIAHARGSVDGDDYLELKRQGSTEVKPNFYHSSWVAETRKCLPTIQLVIKATEALLEQWPDFPTLKDIMTITKRILEFPLTSPVARFLTGLELLRDKIEEWNKNAHKGNNMIDVALTVAHHIVTWRKLELSNWKDSLSKAFDRVESEANKWWFHIYTLVDCFISEKAINNDPANGATPSEESVTVADDQNKVIMTVNDFVTVMKQFIEKSSLAEYKKRLDILFTFHCHVIHMKPSIRRDQVMCILWNLHKYYSQFLPQITQTIKDKRTPIEKKLRDFVKICSWERDLSYWAVKDLVDKAHRTLHKHIKDFENILKTSAYGFLSVDKATEQGTEHVGVWDRPKRVSTTPLYHYMVDPQHYITSIRMAKKYFVDLDNTSKGDPAIPISKAALLPQMWSLLTKAMKLCKETVLRSTYPVLIQSLDGFVTEVIDTSKHLKALEVSPNIPKPKQKAQAKGFLQQKKKALADLFKALTKMGVSYRTGLVESTARNGVIVNFVTPPIDLKAAFTYLKNNWEELARKGKGHDEMHRDAYRRCDSVLLSVWDGCEAYYQRCISRMGALTAALVAPSAELGPQNIERCKGFAIHLMLMVQEQKVRIAKNGKHLCLLRNHVAQITALCESEGQQQNQTVLYSRLSTLKEVYSFVIMTIEQFELLLKAYPKRNTNGIDDSSEAIEFDKAICDSPMVKCFKYDPSWVDVHDKVKQILNVSNKQKNNLNKLSPALPSVYAYKKTENLLNSNILCQPQISVMDEASAQLRDLSSKLSALIGAFKIDTDSEDEIQSPIANCLLDLERYLSKHINHLEHSTEKNKDPVDVKDLERKQETSIEDFSTRIESCVSLILYVIQEMYKKYLKDNNSCDKEQTELNETVGDKQTASADAVEAGEEEEVDQLIHEGHLKKELQESIKIDIADLDIPKLINKLDNIISELNSRLEADAENATEYKKQLSRCVPLLEQITLLAQYFITQQVAVHRVSSKMLSVLLNIFIELTTKGFCIPSEFGEESGEGEGQGKMSGGMGLGEGEGEKDVSERIENQDQLDDAQRPGEEKNKEDDKDCKEEDKGVNMTDDFESHLQDMEKKDGSDQESEDDDDIDKQMGETETGVDKLDQQIWGSDDEEDDNDENENQDKDKEEKGTGKPLGDKQVGAKEPNQEEEEADGDDEQNKDKNKKDINEMEEPEYDDDQVDPYHGNQKPLPEPEPMDLPDDLNLDDQDGKDDEKDGEDENKPFEIDVMEDKKQPPDQQEEQKDEDGKKDAKDQSGANQEDGEDISDEDDNVSSEKKDNPQDEPEAENDNEDETDDGIAEQDEKDPSTEELPEEEKDDNQVKPPQIPEDDVNEDNENEHDENMTEDDNRKNEKEDARPSQDKPTAEDNVESSAMEKGSKDMVQTNPQLDKQDAPFEQSQEQEGDEKEGTGQSELSENQKGHRGDRQDKPKSSAREKSMKEKEKRQDKRNKPGNTEQDRALGEVKEPAKKKMKTLNIQDNKADEEDKEEDEGVREKEDQEDEADIYQHIKKAKETDLQAIDAATKEQAESQPVPNNPDEEGEDVNPEDDIEMDTTEDIQVDEDTVEEIKPEKVGQDKHKESKEKSKDKGDPQGEDPNGEMGVEVEGDHVLTLGAERGADTSYHTKMDMVRVPFGAMEHSGVTGSTIRQALQSRVPDSSGREQSSAWHSLWGQTAAQARLLTERLRLVLEPTGLSRLAGDYRTGRRINMRRVIPYIASHFRKDRIWLRRTRPARREYHIAVAIDDSSSMCDNRSKELAFESLALVSQALNLLEAGELAVLSFGEDPQILHSFGEQFTESSGSKLLENLTFKQTKTRIAKLIDFASAMFEEQCSGSNAPNAKLLLIVSDGRGIFSEGEAKVTQAVRRARQQGVFMVYLIVDNPASEVSIMDIRMPVFNQQTFELENLKPYLDSFPFPFYLILRDVAALPAVLSDALRQWFELAANIDKQ